MNDGSTRSNRQFTESIHSTQVHSQRLPKARDVILGMLNEASGLILGELDQKGITLTNEGATIRWTINNLVAEELLASTESFQPIPKATEDSKKTEALAAAIVSDCEKDGGEIEAVLAKEIAQKIVGRIEENVSKLQANTKQRTQGSRQMG